MYLHMQKYVFPIPPDPSAFLASFVSIKIFPSLELCCYLVSSVLNDYCWVSWNNRHKVSNGLILCITPVTSNQINPNSLDNNKQNNFDSFSCNTLFSSIFFMKTWIESYKTWWQNPVHWSNSSFPLGHLKTEVNSHLYRLSVEKTPQQSHNAFIVQRWEQQYCR